MTGIYVLANAFTDQTAIDMDQLKAEVARVVSSLTELNRRSEPEFSRLGDGLAEVIDKVEHTHQEITKALAMIRGGDDDGILTRMAIFEESVSIRFADNAETIRFCLEKMRGNIGQLRCLETRHQKFSENINRMNAIGIYFAIEIMRSPVALQVFSTYATDIRALFVEMSRLFEQLRNETINNIKLQENVLDSVHNDYTLVVVGVEDALKESTGIINQISTTSSETLERIAKYFFLLKINVGRILTAIQVGDITRQQIEHVIEALAATVPHAMADGQPNVEWCRLLSLQFVQLRHVRTEFIDARATIQEALEQISAVFGILAADVNDLLSGARTVTGAPDWVAELTGELEKMWNLEKKTGTVFQQALGTVDQVLCALSQLRGHVHQIDDNNRRLGTAAYNARILSMRLGAEGRALTTLAKEVSDLSQTTRNYMEAVTGAIASIAAVAEETSHRIQSVRAAQALDGSGAARFERSAIDLLETETEGFVCLTSDACGRARSLQGDMDSIRKTLQSIGHVQEQLEQALAVLGSVVTAVSAAAGEPLVGDSTVNRQHAERYTMETERIIHRQLTDDHNVALTGIESSMNARRDMVVNEDEIGENVELF